MSNGTSAGVFRSGWGAHRSRTMHSIAHCFSNTAQPSPAGPAPTTTTVVISSSSSILLFTTGGETRAFVMCQITTTLVLARNQIVFSKMFALGRRGLAVAAPLVSWNPCPMTYEVLPSLLALALAHLFSL